MRVYVSGGMTGRPTNGFPPFDSGAALLRRLGHDPVSPADIDRAHGVYETTTEFPEGFRQAALRRDIEAILTCDAIAFLPCWERSRGARVERTVAEAIGLPCWRVDPEAGKFWPETYIGISGYARAGKDSLARFLRTYGYEVRSFAAPMKAILYALDPTVRLDEDSHGTVKQLVDAFGWDEAKGHDEVRRLLQRLGTEGGRHHLGDDVWVEALFSTPSSGRLVIPDVRFPNEAQAIKDRGGLMVRVERPGVEPANGHLSEHALDGFDFDLVVPNDGSLTDLMNQAERVARLAKF